MPTEEKRTQAIEEILLNEECLKKIYAAQNDEEIQDVFREKGVELDAKQLKSLKLAFKEVLEKAKQALNDRDLEQVSGGKINSERIIDSTVAGAGAGGAAGLIFGSAIGGLYAVAHTLGNMDRNSGFLENYSKIMFKAASAAVLTGAVGAGIGAGLGASIEASSSGTESNKTRI